VKTIVEAQILKSIPGSSRQHTFNVRSSSEQNFSL